MVNVIIYYNQYDELFRGETNHLPKIGETMCLFSNDIFGRYKVQDIEWYPPDVNCNLKEWKVIIHVE